MAGAADMPMRREAGPGRAILDAAIASLAGKTGQVGWFSSSKYPDGTPAAYVAAIQEFGYAPKNIPPRMGLRAMTVEKQAEWSSKIAVGAKQVFKGVMDGAGLMELISGVAEADVRAQIKSVVNPPLKESTLENRAHRHGIKLSALTATGAKPLNDTGYMLDQVTHLVSDSDTP